MLWRVRDIADLDYTHYVKERFGDRPDTPEKVLAFASESCKNLAKCYGIDIRYTIQKDGKLTIRQDDYRTKAWLQHIANQNLSKNNFQALLIEELQLINGTVEAESGATKELIKIGKTINKQLKVISDEIRDSEFQKIIDCPDITRERYNELKDCDIIDPAEALMVKRHMVRRFYSLPDDKVIDMAFLRTYWKVDVRALYLHRKNVHGFDGIRSTINNMAPVIVGSFFYGNNTETFTKLLDISRDKYCLEFLDMFGFSFSGPERTLTRGEVIEILHTNHDTIAEKWGPVRGAFDCNDISKPPAKDNERYVLNMLKHINGKLNKQYGINIKTTDDSGKNEYKIEDTFNTLFDANFQPIK